MPLQAPWVTVRCRPVVFLFRISGPIYFVQAPTCKLGLRRVREVGIRGTLARRMLHRHWLYISLTGKVDSDFTGKLSAPSLKSRKGLVRLLVRTHCFAASMKCTLGAIEDNKKPNCGKA